MRITGNRLMQMNTDAVTRNQARVGELAQEVSSGKRVTKPSDDPAAWVASHRAGMRQALADGAVEALESAGTRVDQTDAALTGISDIVAQVRTIAVQASSDTYNADGRAALGQQVRMLFQAAVGFANARSPDGEYLLAGTRSTTAPFDATTGAYTGDAVAREVPSDETTLLGYTVAGSELTASVPGGVDVLQVLDRVATALTANDATGLQTALGELETATRQMSTLRSRVGAIMGVLADATSANKDLSDRLTAESSRLVESDTVDAASRLAQATQALDVSRAVSASVANTLARATQP
jgi:flagellar hook-associated protein 3 FlgL